jgi:hypothetical protein
VSAKSEGAANRGGGNRGSQSPYPKSLLDVGPAAAELGISMEATPIFHEPHEILIVKTMRQP